MVAVVGVYFLYDQTDYEIEGGYGKVTLEWGRRECYLGEGSERINEIISRTCLYTL